MNELISLRRAAEIVGKSESTLSKDMKTGKMKYVRKTPNGQGYLIDIEEVYRVYPQKSNHPEKQRSENINKDQLIASLRAENEFLRSDREAWRQQAQFLAQR